MRYRSYRGSRRRSSLGNVVKSFKKVLNVIPASYTSGFTNVILTTGVDAISPGQLSITDQNIPTGSVVKYIEIQFAAVNLTATAGILGFALQYFLAGQTPIDPSAVGGHPQRNQVLHQACIAAGDNQNVNRTFKFKIPKKFQRTKEGMGFAFSWSTNVTVTAAIQVIYKLYS